MENESNREPKIRRYSRKSITANLEDYCYLAKEHDYIEICEWHNQDGYDITINDQIHSFTHGQLKAIRKLIKQL